MARRDPKHPSRPSHPSLRQPSGAASGLLCLALLLPLLAACSEGEQPASAVAASERASEGRRYVVSLEPRTTPIPVARRHDWVVRVAPVGGGAISPGQIQVSGGLPAGGQALAQRPRVTRELGPGEWLVEGLEFGSAGDWVLRVELDGSVGRDMAHFPVHVGP